MMKHIIIVQKRVFGLVKMVWARGSKEPRTKKKKNLSKHKTVKHNNIQQTEQNNQKKVQGVCSYFSFCFVIMGVKTRGAGFKTTDP